MENLLKQKNDAESSIIEEQTINFIFFSALFVFLTLAIQFGLKIMEKFYSHIFAKIITKKKIQ